MSLVISSANILRCAGDGLKFIEIRQKLSSFYSIRQLPKSLVHTKSVIKPSLPILHEPCCQYLQASQAYLLNKNLSVKINSNDVRTLAP